MTVHPSSLTDVVTALEDDLQKLRWGVVANVGRVSSKRMPRWAHVREATGFGSTSSRALCLAVNFDPDEMVGGDPEMRTPSETNPRAPRSVARSWDADGREVEP